MLIESKGWFVSNKYPLHSSTDCYTGVFMGLNLKPENFFDFFIPRNHFDAERYGGATGQTVVLLKIDGLSRNFFHLESP